MARPGFKSLITIISLGILLAVNFNNCSNVQFGADPNFKGGSTGDLVPNDNTATENLDIVQKTCMNSTPLVMEQSVSFINPENQSCNFGIGDNLPPRDGYFQGHIDQASNFSLPAGATICGVDFEFSANGSTIRYDDHFLLTFNDIVIAGTFDFSSDLDHLLGMNVYSWDKIRGSPWHSRQNLEGIFCEGAKDGKAACSWPNTDTFGTINMRFDDIVFQKIFATNPNREQHSFHLVSIGDNDSNDCEISPIAFKVKVQYVK